MPIRIAATGVSHWHSLHDSAYLRHAAGMVEVAIVGVQDPEAAVAARRAAALGNPPAFTDERAMLRETRPDFVIALGRHRDMARTAHLLLDAGVPFMMEKPMGVNAAEVAGVAERAAATRAFVAVPLIQRHGPFFARARQLLAGERLGTLSHFYFRLNRPTSARYPAWEAGWMLDPAVAGGGCLRNLGAHGLDLFVALVGETTDVLGASVSARGLGAPVEDYASVLVRSRTGVIGTVEVGNLFPRDGTDGESKLAGRDGILIERAGALTLETREGATTERAEPAEPLAKLALRDILDRFQRGASPLVTVHDLLPVVRLIDRAYALAGG
jgi:predicted dehydrogenase